MIKLPQAQRLQGFGLACMVQMRAGSPRVHWDPWILRWRGTSSGKRGLDAPSLNCRCLKCLAPRPAMGHGPSDRTSSPPPHSRTLGLVLGIESRSSAGPSFALPPGSSRIRPELRLSMVKLRAHRFSHISNCTSFPSKSPSESIGPCSPRLP